MVSPTSAASSASSAKATSATSATRTTTATAGSAKSAPGTETGGDGRSPFAELLAERDAAGARGLPLGAGAGAGSEGELGQLAGLLGDARGGFGAALHGAKARASGSDEGALDGSEEARADGLDADEDPAGAAAAALASGDHGARAAHPLLDDPLSPWARHCQQMVAPLAISTGGGAGDAAGAAEAAAAPEQTARTSLQELMPALVKKVAWSGDGTRGAVRLELGAGSLAGSTLLVHADGKRVRVQLDAPAGTNAAEWQREIRSRLEARGLTVDDVEVS
jgi:hypothetical protein